MKDNWKEITDPEELFRLKREGWEIEYRHLKTEYWRPWVSTWWQTDTYFRARPSQQKIKTIKALCWYDPTDGAIFHTSKNLTLPWKRFPAGDIEGEIE